MLDHRRTRVMEDGLDLRVLHGLLRSALVAALVVDGRLDPFRPCLHAAFDGSMVKPFLYVSMALWYSFMSISRSPSWHRFHIFFIRLRAFYRRLAAASSRARQRRGQIIRIAGFFGSRFMASS